MTHKFVRGGQLSMHTARMFIQVVNSSFRMALLVMLFCIGVFFFTNFNDLKMSQLVGYTLAWLYDYIGLEQQYINIENISMTAKAILKTSKYQIAFNTAKKGFFISTFIGFITWVGLLIFFYRSGHSPFAKKILRGFEVVSPRVLKKIIQRENRREKYNAYEIAGVPYTLKGEKRHTLVIGTTGSGKTVEICALLDQIKKRGDKAIIYDKMGVYVERFYDEKKDIILNPFDKRSPCWSVFNEVKSAAHFDSIANAFIPKEKGTADQFWPKSARTIFASVCGVLRDRGGVTNKQLADMLLKTNLEEVAKLVKGTAAQAILDPNNPKTALSVMTMISTYLKSFQYLKDEGELFSIRDWVLEENSDKLLFITSQADLHSSLMPLITGWFEIAINNMLTLPQSDSRWIWVLLDELPSLQWIPSLVTGLAELRQYEVCFVLGAQSFAQIESCFERDGSRVINALCGNKLYLKSPDFETAKWCSDNLGQVEIEEFKEGKTFGENRYRDGVNLNKSELIKPAVHPVDIMTLKELEGYLSLSNQPLIAKIKLKFKKWPTIAPKFVEYMLPLVTKQDVKLKHENIENKEIQKENLLKENLDLFSGC